ncbi:hypothetical protein PIB30_084986, partial [Stylosanthes scabra]|nr:hypothetical protein [Stylosanthes scabra]
NLMQTEDEEGAGLIIDLNLTTAEGVVVEKMLLKKTDLSGESLYHIDEPIVARIEDESEVGILPRKSTSDLSSKEDSLVEVSEAKKVWERGGLFLDQSKEDGLINRLVEKKVMGKRK